MADHDETASGFRSKTEMAADYVSAIEEWMEPLEGRFYSMTYLLMFMKLIATPGIKRGELALFLEVKSKISRSTAERAISEARKADLINITDPTDRRGLEIHLSDHLDVHFTNIFEHALKRSEWRLKASHD